MPRRRTEDCPPVSIPPIKNGTKLTLAIMAINFLLFVGNLYLSNGYVSKATYESDAKDALKRREDLTLTLGGIAGDLRVIKEHLEGDKVQNEQLKSLDERLRVQEQRKR